MNHVASDIGIHQKYLPSKHIQSQQNLTKIEDWTLATEAKLNVGKSKVLIFNFTDNFPFSTRLYMDNVLLEIISETNLLGTIVSADLKWYQNTEMLIAENDIIAETLFLQS